MFIYIYYIYMYMIFPLRFAEVLAGYLKLVGKNLPRILDA